MLLLEPGWQCLEPMQVFEKIGGPWKIKLASWGVLPGSK
jgi:hypothetical protein